jgi:hypothetical protein
LGHEAPTLKAEAADQGYDDACHHYGFGGLNLLRPFGLVAFLAGLTQKISAHALQDVCAVTNKGNHAPFAAHAAFSPRVFARGIPGPASLLP